MRLVSPFILSPRLLRFLKFCVVGSLGFLWDASSVYALRPIIGLTAATLAAYFIAATFNWLLNSLWTFRGVGHHSHPVLQWLRFLSANSLGFFLNRGTVYTLFYVFPLCIQHPILALACGSFAGLIANFNLCQKIVFREKPPTSALELAEMTVEIPATDHTHNTEP
ncbi:GtrA family protein [Acetobacter lambici]|uniref:GtrA family protein n=1 Tax=Acetobacter lambici TaxID=1332824 RepID=A0ABT1EWQ7_9PROT|nr:GtrA family protein [Acetobacter lambici]MCP1241985.1 GtrA family protein [Acetobacter lambici]MCP1257397.1 GtrA family protein [Acetobacter lambici]NHO56461.1 GtrA family protein [Acetobacter lambici]